MKTAHLNAFRALEATLRCGSQRAAADDLGVTPAAVAQHIRTLEDILGTQLFARTPKGLQPSEASRAVADDLHGAFETLARVRDRLTRDAHGQAISITLPVSFAENWFTPRLQRLYRDVGALDFRIDASNRMVDLAREGFDFALRYAGPSEEGVVEDILFRDAVLPLATPAFVEAHHAEIQARDMSTIPLADLGRRTPDPSWADWPIWQAASGVSGTTTHGATFSNFASGLSVARTGQALVLCGVVEAYGALKDGSLIAPFGPKASIPTDYAYRLVRPELRRMTRVGAAVRTWMLKEAEVFVSELSEFLNASPK